MKFDWVRSIPEGVRIFVRPGHTDMRKSIFTLGYLVQSEMKMDTLSHAIFLFCNRRKDTIKVLYWDDNGFCLWLKKLDSDRFPFPNSEALAEELNLEKLSWLLNGIDFRKEHKKYEIRNKI